MGRSAAVQLAAKGAHLILVSRNVGRLEEALAEVKVRNRQHSRPDFSLLSSE